MTQIQINASPHASQGEIHQHPARHKVVDAGRRWGKTRLAVMECFDVAAQGGRAWWVAPSYKMSEVGWRPMRRIAGQIGAEVRLGDRLVNLPNGGSIAVRSADNPDSLRGEGLDFVVLDECAFMQEQAWTEALRPALSDRKGRSMFIGTPKGRNWFWRLWTKGQDKSDGDWQSWQFPTSDNPFIDPDEIEEARHDLPERIFAQEYMAAFLEDGGGVFRNVMACATATQQDEPIDGHEYVFGVDWGKLSDFTVISVIDLQERALVHYDRFNQIDYTVQVGRLQALYERFRPHAIIAERNSMGEPLIEQLVRMDMPVQPFTTTNATKADIIDALTLAFERKELAILPDQTLINELQAYEMERLPSGTLRYSAPAGMHDDMVMSLALAYYGISGAAWLIY